jgi:hypothetical protein
MNYGAEPVKGPATTADKVEVFVRSAPEGFTLKKNELTVLPGYDTPRVGNC